MYFLKYFGYDIDFHMHHFFSVQEDLESFLFRNITIDGDTKIGFFYLQAVSFPHFHHLKLIFYHKYHREKHLSITEDPAFQYLDFSTLS